MIDEMPVDVLRRLRSLGPHRCTAHEQRTVNRRKTAEGQDPGEHGNVEERTRRLESRENAGQRGDERAEIDWIPSVAMRQAFIRYEQGLRAS